MSHKPGYQIYQEEMLKCCHGFPHWDADPYGDYKNEDGTQQILLGDVGYFSEGKFVRIKSLQPLHETLGRSKPIEPKSRRVYMPEPVFSEDVKRTALDAEGKVTTSPVGGGAQVAYTFSRSQGALLNVEEKAVEFSFCDDVTKDLLGKYMRQHYKEWLRGSELESLETPPDLFLVTGTYMTDNWEAIAFSSKSIDMKGAASVNAVAVEGRMSFNWSSWNQKSPDFNFGHNHPGQNIDGELLASKKSFNLCCKCNARAVNQCIFLRGFWIKEKSAVLGRNYVKQLEARGEEKFRVVKRMLLGQKDFTARGRGPTKSHSMDSGLALNRGVYSPPPDVNLAAELYDEVARINTDFEGEGSDDVVLVHDDDVIRHIELATVALRKWQSATKDGRLLSPQ